jgi:hypothetical protein
MYPTDIIIIAIILITGCSKAVRRATGSDIAPPPINRENPIGLTKYNIKPTKS